MRQYPEAQTFAQERSRRESETDLIGWLRLVLTAVPSARYIPDVCGTGFGSGARETAAGTVMGGQVARSAATAIRSETPTFSTPTAPVAMPGVTIDGPAEGGGRGAETSGSDARGLKATLAARGVRPVESCGLGAVVAFAVDGLRKIRSEGCGGVGIMSIPNAEVACFSSDRTASNGCFSMARGGAGADDAVAKGTPSCSACGIGS